ALTASVLPDPRGSPSTVLLSGTSPATVVARILFFRFLGRRQTNPRTGRPPSARPPLAGGRGGLCPCFFVSESLSLCLLRVHILHPWGAGYAPVGVHHLHPWGAYPARVHILHPWGAYPARVHILHPWGAYPARVHILHPSAAGAR